MRKEETELVNERIRYQGSKWNIKLVNEKVRDRASKWESKRPS